MKLEYASPDDRKFRDWLRKYREEIGGEAPSDAWLDAYTRHIFSEQGKHRHIWWGVDGGRRIGFAVAMVIQQPVDRGRQQGMIAEFFIYPEYRREGYGRKLADAIIEFFQERGITDVHASVIADNVRGIRMDVTDLGSIEAFKQAAYAKRPQIDIVVNVAGWGKVEPFVKNTPDFWRKVIDLNFLGPVAVTRAFLDQMVERKSGKIVTVASDAGRVGSLGETVYSGAKGGAIAFTKSLAREMARFNINVNCVCPGPTDTPLLAAVPEKFREAFIRVTPMGRLAKPSEVADAVLFFASSRAEFVTGQTLSVSGGLTLAG